MGENIRYFSTAVKNIMTKATHRGSSLFRGSGLQRDNSPLLSWRGVWHQAGKHALQQLRAHSNRESDVQRVWHVTTETLKSAPGDKPVSYCCEETP